MSRKFPKNAIPSYVQTHAKRIFHSKKGMLDVPRRGKPDLCWLKYDSASRHELDWVQDLETCLRWIHVNGIVLLVFPRRNNLSFILQQIQRKGQLHDIYHYQDKHSHMVALSVVKRKANQPQLSRFAAPQVGQRVRVKDHTGTWEGVVRSQYAHDEYEVYQGKQRYSVFKEEITHVLT